MGSIILVGNRTIDRSRITGQSADNARADMLGGNRWLERFFLGGAATLGVTVAILLDPLMNLFA